MRQYMLHSLIDQQLAPSEAFSLPHCFSAASLPPTGSLLRDRFSVRKTPPSGIVLRFPSHSSYLFTAQSEFWKYHHAEGTMGLFSRSNDALSVNPTVGADIAITTHGSDWYWAVTAVMALSTFIFIGMSYTVPRRNRIFHYITASITLVASIAYFSMASNLGYTGISVEFTSHLDGTAREIFYVRYIDWVITTPLLLLDLLLTAGLPWPTILFTLLLDEVMIVVGLVGALVASSYKWGYFTFGMFALFGVAWNVAWVARKHAFVLGTEVHRTFLMCGVWTLFLWFLYPISWGLSEGGNIIHPDSEAAFYGVLDILAKPVFGFLLLFGHRNIDPAVLGLHLRDYDGEVGTASHEKPVTSTRAANNAVVTDAPATTV